MILSVPPLEPLGASTYLRTQQTAIEEVEDEDDVPPPKKKKVKKKKKNHNKHQDTRTTPPFSAVQQSMSPSPSTPSNGAKKPPAGHSPSQSLQSSQEIPKSSKILSTSPSHMTPSKETPHKTTREPAPKHSSGQSSIQSPLDILDPNFSRASLPLAHETNAQSARAYLQSENVTMEKTKVKTRPAFARTFFKADNELKKTKESGVEKKGLLDRVKKINLPKRIGDSMLRLISPTDGKAQAKKPMKWEEFLKVRQFCLL